jgi:putative flavoprotein involved in K+ transport
MREHHDTVVIGGGQAGLVMSSVLQQRGREHVVLERRRVGERWRTERWDSLRFQFPNWTIRLPGYRYRGNDPNGNDPNGFAHYTEILRVIEDYAGSTRAPVWENMEVVGLTEDADGNGFVVSLSERSLHARSVVVATGPFQGPLVPPLSGHVLPTVLQTDPTRYRSPVELPAGAVLVVGSGASGCQIADELLRAGRRVFLSVSRHRRAPRRFRGKDVYWWLEKMGRLAQTIDSFPDRQWPPSVVITGVNGGYDVNVRQLVAGGAEVVGRVVGASGGTLAIQADANRILDQADDAYANFLSTARALASTGVGEDLDDEESVEAPNLPAGVDEVDSLDLARQNIATILWATGYAFDFGWLKIPVFDQQGRPVQHRGVTGRPGLYFLGLHWMHTFKSGLLAGVGDDAEYLADQISRTP